MADKKVVMFERCISAPRVGARCALGGVKGHYRLGDCDWVDTSFVVEVRDAGRTIETKNTIYKQIKADA